MRMRAIERARNAIDDAGIALVYPVPNHPAFPSLWSALYPKSKMEWAWDWDADPRVAEVWHLRERLAHSHEVAYAKWFRGRATFFSLPVFTAIHGRIAKAGDPFADLPHAANDILDLLRGRSPLSTKEVRAGTDLRGKDNERVFTHAMKALWSKLLIVGTGSVPRWRISIACVWRDGASLRRRMERTDKRAEECQRSARRGAREDARVRARVREDRERRVAARSRMSGAPHRRRPHAKKAQSALARARCATS